MPAIEDPFTFSIIGAMMEVHRELGPGFVERVYHEASAKEFRRRGIPFEAEAWLQVHYKGQPLETTYLVDFVCNAQVLVEVKALRFIGDVEKAQVLNHLRASGFPLALLVNFGAESLEWRRFVHKWPPGQAAPAP